MEPRLLAVPREARPYQGERAGLVTRTLTIVVDALTVALAIVVGFAALNALLFATAPRDFHLLAPSPLVSVVVTLAVLVTYLTVAWSVTGRTYGDHLMGVRVVDRQRQQVRPLRAFARALLYVVFPVGVLWCAGNSSRRTLQDRLLGTSVVYDWVRGPGG
jgi:uncharacterized RDD family membrane protein YckC